MSIKLYDDALFAKFNKWVANTPTILTGVNETKRLFEAVIDKNNDKPIQLPLIALSRPGGYSVLLKNKQPLSYNGLTVASNMHRGAKLNAIPISISYQIDIYCRYLAEADEYARNMVFNIINYPKLEVDIPYENQGQTHISNIRLNSDVEDNSDIPERLIPGQFTRLTMTIEVDDAYLFDLRIQNNVSIVDVDVSSLDTTVCIDNN
jgi:hypothetical protein